MSNLRIFIADDHEIVRHGLRLLLETQPGWTVCGEAGDGREALKLCRQLQPDVAILDLKMPELHGLEVARRLRKILPATELLVLSVHESEEVAAELIDAGVHGYLVKTDSPRMLMAAVEAVASHKLFFSGRFAQSALNSRLYPPPPGRIDETATALRLTSREREIVQLLAEGGSNKEISVKLGIAVKTVDSRRANVMRRLNLHSIAGLVRYAIREQIIEA